MKKQLGILASFVVFSVLAFATTACGGGRGYNYYDNVGDVGPAVYQTSPEQYHTAPTTSYDPYDRYDRNEPCCAPQVKCKYPHSNCIESNGVTVSASQPKLCILGDNYAMDICVRADVSVCHVEVNALLPEGVSLVRSEPEGVTENHGVLTWMFDAMDQGETRHSRVILRADREGDLCVCFCVTAVPVQFCSVLCARPVLECHKCGPEEVCPGDPVHYTITVSNRGSCTAEEVVVTDIVPEGLEHSSGLKTLTYKLGNLEPCQTKKINACFTAVKRGRVCNMINVTACNANPTSCQCCTNICKQCIELVKVGPKERKIGETADYEITVTNPGDKSLTGVVLCDQAPAATSIVEARGATINGNQAVWRWDELKPGEKQTVVLTLTTCTPGYFVNRVSVDNCQRCYATAEWGTRWRGTPAINACFADLEDPICVGQPTAYILRVTNQGSEEDTNLNVVIRFPREIVPTAASGASRGTISGQTVTFNPVAILGARQTVEFRIDAVARDRGDARIKAEVSTDSIRTPIVQEESTIVN